MTEINRNLNNYISLAEASRLTSYNQDYLGSLCRDGKLKGTKIGRNWVTTREAVSDLLQTMGEVSSVAIPVKVIGSAPIKTNNIPNNSFVESKVESLPIAIKPTSSGKPLNHISNIKQKLQESFVLPSLNRKKKINKIPTAAIAFAAFVIIFGFATAHGKNLLGDFFGHSKFNNFTYNIISDSNKINDLQDGQVASANNRNSNSGIILGTSVKENNSVNSISESNLNKLILTNLENLGSSGWFNKYIDNTLPSQVQPPYQQTQLPLNPPAPISYFLSPSQPFSGGSILGVTDLSSHRFITDTAIINNTLSVIGDATFEGDINLTGALNPGLTAGSVVFQGASGLAQDNSNFFYDDTRNSLGIGTVTPSALVSVAGSSNTGAGNITSSSGTSVTGTGTAFTTQLKVGDIIVVNGQPRTVATIVSNTSLTTTTAFNPALTTTPSVSYVNTATTNTGSTESNTLTWNHYVDSTVENRMLIVAIATHKNTALVIPTVASVTYGSQTMTLFDSRNSTNTGLIFYRLVAPEVGTKQITITLSSSATARMVAQSVLLANVNQATPIGGGSSGGGTGDTAGGSAFGSSTRYGGISIISFDANITADYDEDGSLTGTGPSVELGNLSTGSTTNDARLLVGFTNLNTLLFGSTYWGVNFWELSGSTNYVNSSASIINSATATGAFVYRSSFLSVKDSVSYEQIKIGGDGQASFHNGISVDLSGAYGYNTNLALFNGGFVGIGTTAPTNELSVTGDADFSGSLAVGGSAVDPTVYLNLVNTGAYGGDGVVRYGFAADLTATDLSNVTAGYFSAGSSYGVSGADHNVLTGLDVHTNFSGAGRVDNSQGVYIQVANSNTGNMKDAYGVYNQILGSSGQTSGVAIAYYADIVTTSSVGPIASASAFLGKIRKLGGTSGFGTVYGMQLSGWDPGVDTDGVAGAPYDYAIGTSYGIYMDTSIDVGDTRYALWSSSTSQSYLQGALGIGDTSPDASLEVVNDGSGDSFLVADTNDGDSTPFVIDSTGKVGIGLASPGAKLDILSVTNQIGTLISQTTAAITTAGNALLKVTSNQADTSDQLILFENTVTTANYGNSGSNSGMVRILNASTSTGGTTTTNPNVAGLYIQTIDLDTISLLVRNNNSGTIAMQNVGTAGAQGDPGVLTVEGLGDTTNVYNLITAYNSTTRSDAAAVFRVQADGNVYGEAAFNASGADYAEYFETTDTSITGGEVVVADKTLGYKEKIVKSSKAYDANLLGIVSTNPAFVGNNAGGGNENKDNYKLVALVGRVPVKVTNENGNIKIGDYLTSSEQFPGYAMKATEPGMVIGKALESFDGDGVNSAGGQVLVFINMHTYTPMVVDVLQGTDPLYSDLSDLNLLDSNLFNKIVVRDSLYVEGTIYVKGKAIIQELQVGSSNKPSGITLYDDDSGQPYCVKIKSGQWVQAEGDCETATNFQQNFMPITPRDPAPIDPVIDPAPQLPQPEPEPTAGNIDQSPAL